MKFVLKCIACGQEFDRKEVVWRCACGGLLDLVGEVEFRREDVVPSRFDMWRYQRALPVSVDDRVSFDEGMTPLVRTNIAGREIFIKQDHLFQTGSYKDRGAAVLISHVKSLGVAHVVEDSSGNAGCAIAAYCARAGIACDIYVPESTSRGKLVQIERYGANLVKIPGSREDTARAVMQAAQSHYYASHSWNPFFFHGTKTFAYEVCEQLGWAAPDVVVLPAGNGTLLLGAHLGFGELYRSGVIEAVPRIIGVQAHACRPLAEAFRENLEDIPAIQKQETLAEGIAIAQPVRGMQIVRAVRSTGGQFVTVSEAEIKHSLLDLCAQGFFVEPTAAATIAGVAKIANQLPPDALVVSALTGHGLKATEKLLELGAKGA